MQVPLPVSVDDLPTGARLAFMRYDSSQGLREAGALRLEVLETSEGTKVSVSRSFAKASRAAKFEIPGEGRVMSAFMQEFKFLLGEDEKRTRKVDEASDDDSSTLVRVRACARRAQPGDGTQTGTSRPRSDGHRPFRSRQWLRGCRRRPRGGGPRHGW